MPDQDALRQLLDGYSGAMATSLHRQIKAGRQHLKALADSAALRSPTGYLEQRRQIVLLLKNRLISAQTQSVERKKRRFVEQTAKLDAMSPLKVLTRGYAMAQSKDGSVLRSVSQVEIADPITVTFGDGSVSAMVTDIKEKV